MLEEEMKQFDSCVERVKKVREELAAFEVIQGRMSDIASEAVMRWGFQRSHLLQVLRAGVNAELARIRGELSTFLSAFTPKPEPKKEPFNWPIGDPHQSNPNAHWINDAFEQFAVIIKEPSGND
jgi:hypothetical protein